MKTENKLGIWMDHANAHLIDFTETSDQTKTIHSKFTHDAKEHSLGKSENLMHHKEQHQQSEYYNRIGEAIKNYGEVILFGPTDAKNELFNVLRKDHRFEKVKIDIKNADKMTEEQQRSFVKEFFNKPNLIK
jgi:hypothetical protein